MTTTAVIWMCNHCGHRQEFNFYVEEPTDDCPSCNQNFGYVVPPYVKTYEI